MSAHSDIAALPTGGHRKPCPYCQKGPGDRALSVTVNPGGVVWNCFRCGWSGCLKRGASHTPLRAPSPKAQVSQIHETLSPYWRDTWEGCRPIGGDARAYLEARCCVMPPPDGDLRWHPKLQHPSNYVGPALVGLITDVFTNKPISLHRTWIRPDGKKAPLHLARLVLKGHRKAGGVIRLWPDESVTQGLSIAEGIESALSAAHAFTPVWSCIDAGNLGEFPALSGIGCLSIVADNDPAGVRAAQKCANRWMASGAKARIIKSSEPGTDLNDILMRGAA
jgi:putative DNA primase/helicase